MRWSSGASTLPKAWRTSCQLHRKLMSVSTGATCRGVRTMGQGWPALSSASHCRGHTRGHARVCWEEKKAEKERRGIQTICKMGGIDQYPSTSHKYCMIYWNKRWFLLWKKCRSRWMWNNNQKLTAESERHDRVKNTEQHQKFVLIPTVCDFGLSTSFILCECFS